MKRYSNLLLIVAASASLLIALIGVLDVRYNRNIEGLKEKIAENFSSAAHLQIQELPRKWDTHVFQFDSLGKITRWGNNTCPIELLNRDSGTPFQFLGNGLYQCIKLSNTLFYVSKLVDDYPITNKYFFNKNNAFRIKLQKEQGYKALKTGKHTVYVSQKPSLPNSSILLLFLAIFFFSQAYCKHINPNALVLFSFYLISAIAFYSWPNKLDYFSVFSPEVYASSGLNNSLGSLAFNILLLSGVFQLLKILQNKGYKWQRQTPVFAIFFISYSYLFSLVVRSLVSDSKLNLVPFNYLDRNAFDNIALGVLFFASYLFIKAMFEFYREKKNTPILCVLVIGANLVAFKMQRADLIEINWYLPLILLAYIPSEKFQLKNITALLIMVFGLNFILTKYINYREKGQINYLAEKFAENEDPLVNYLVEESLPQLIARFEKDSAQNPESFLTSNLMLGYLAKFTLKQTNSSDSESAYSFAFQEKNYALYLKGNVSSFGFPQLFANKNFEDEAPLTSSFGLYQNGALLKSIGEYDFSRKLKIENERKKPDELYAKKQLLFGNKVVVVKSEFKPWIEKFAFIVFLFSLLALAYFATLYGALFEVNFTTIKFKTQFAFTGVLLLTAFSFAILATKYSIQQFENNNQNTLVEKLNAVILELSEKFKTNPALSQNSTALESELKKLAAIFYTDISLYSAQGDLQASSQPLLFEKHILSAKMEPKAFRLLNSGKREKQIYREQLGDLNYLSAYRVLYTSNGAVAAYVNLPYFAKQKELNAQLGTFLVGVVSVLFVLIALAFSAAIFLADQITKPLAFLEKSMQQLDLHANTTINYSSKNEIGQLVKAYNTKVEELLAQANELAKSQREMAWREMAKQVAHEIKNPLTPIKLSAQHLQRSIVTTDVELEKRIKAFITSLLAQVDNLSNIANAFSSFAQLPKAEPEEVELNTLVNEASLLFANQQEITLNLILCNEEAFVFADKNLLIRVITNLLKNAEQAIQNNGGALGVINIELRQSPNEVLLSIADNGGGISPEVCEKIFQPNFTTKTSGMGLGLAMVKQIVEQAQGKIEFSTEWRVGTTFNIILPKYKTEYTQKNYI